MIIDIRIIRKYLVRSFFIFFYLKIFNGNHKSPNIAAKIATIIPIVAAITPPPIPGPR